MLRLHSGNFVFAARGSRFAGKDIAYRFSCSLAHHRVLRDTALTVRQFCGLLPTFTVKVNIISDFIFTFAFVPVNILSFLKLHTTSDVSGHGGTTVNMHVVRSMWRKFGKTIKTRKINIKTWS